MQNQYKPYAGIGSRKVPKDLAQAMTKFAMALGKAGFTLRSGHADGSDMAFEQGAIAGGYPKEIYVPWFGFNNAPQNHPDYIRVRATEELAKLSAQFHPNWNACGDAAKLLHMRNAFQILGPDLNSLSLFVLCWTPNGSSSGGTGQAIRIANHFQIPVFDLAVPQHRGMFIEYVTSL